MYPVSTKNISKKKGNLGGGGIQDKLPPSPHTHTKLLFMLKMFTGDLLAESYFSFTKRIRAEHLNNYFISTLKKALPCKDICKLFEIHENPSERYFKNIYD